MSILTSAERKALRAKAHHIDPVVTVGKNGVTSPLLAEVNEALIAHELVKVRFQGHKDEKRELSALIAERCQCELVDVIGNIAILYLEAPEDRSD